MIDNLIELLELRPVLMLFLILGLGYLIGNIRVGSFSLGPVAGVLFAGLFFGHFGLRLAPATQQLGFALFIFSVGYQAGPRFFSAIKENGVKYFVLTLVVAALIYSASSYLGCVTSGGSTPSRLPSLISQFWQVAALAILVIGHTLNLVLAVASGFIHGLRLNVIEFFNWGLPEEGSLFRPFRKKGA